MPGARAARLVMIAVAVAVVVALMATMVVTPGAVPPG